MSDTPCTTEQSTFVPSSVTEVKREKQRVPRRPWSRITLGFWLGGIVFGTAGGLLGASLSYHQPVARVLSVLWWGIYCGCFGASLGTLPGLFLRCRIAGPPLPHAGRAAVAAESHGRETVPQRQEVARWGGTGSSGLANALPHLFPLIGKAQVKP
jgi:hypothetical protein